PQQQADRGALAGAVGAEQGGDLAGMQGQVEPVERAGGAVAFVHASQACQRRCRFHGVCFVVTGVGASCPPPAGGDSHARQRNRVTAVSGRRRRLLLVCGGSYGARRATPPRPLGHNARQSTSSHSMNNNADLLRELRIGRSSGPPRSRKGLWIALAAIAVVLALAAAGWWLFAGDKPVPVQTATAVALSSGSAPASVLDASGYVVARRMATVSAKITGRVREVLIEEGMQVEEGQVMATLDPVDADAQRTLSASQLAAARSEIARVQAQLAEAEANARRLGALVGQQLVSRAQHDQAVATRDALRAQMESARRNAKVASDGLHIADLGVDNTVVRAPFAGVVIAKAAQPGEIVSPLSAGGGFTRTGIGTIVDMDSLEVEVDVGEAYIGRVQPKMPVQATLNA